MVAIVTILYSLFGLKTKCKKGNLVKYKGNYLRGCNFIIRGKNNSVLIEEYGQNRLTNCRIFINGNNNHIVLGKMNRFTNADLHIEDDNNKILFKDNNTIRGFTHVAAIEGCRIEFGSGSLFSTNVIFRVGDSHSILDAQTRARINPSKSIKIGDRVWFGYDTKILKGVTIENDVVVATGSIVTKSIKESNVAIGGTPAKVLKRGISWCKERI